MNAWPSESTPQQTGGGGCDPDPPGACDLAGFDDLACSVDGIAAQAEYLKGFKAKLAERRTRFDTVRAEYQQMLTTVGPALDQLTADLKEPDTALCAVPAADRECLKSAWKTVEADLTASCGAPGGGCCVAAADRTFDARLGDPPTVAELQAVIARYEGQAGRVEACFDKLAGEPAALRKRVDDLTALVVKIKANKDQHLAYAQMLWAGHLLKDVRGGFATAAEFESCLCTALNASLEGRQKLGDLTGLLAVQTCKDKGKADRCSWLRGRAAEETVARCKQGHASGATAR